MKKREKLTPAEAVRALNALRTGDPEAAHGRADDILLAVVPARVQRAYEAVQARTKWWATS